MNTRLVVAASGSPVRLKKSESNVSNRASPRSAFFSMLMKELSGSDGSQVADFLVKKDMDKFRKSMHAITENIINDAAKKDFKFD